MEKIQKIIVILLIVAVIFSVISTLLNLSLINFEFQPVNVRIPGNLQGDSAGNVGLTVESGPNAGG